MLGGTVYTFSIILAVFLIGLGLGSAAGSALARGVKSPRVGAGDLPVADRRRRGLDGIHADEVGALLAG